MKNKWECIPFFTDNDVADSVGNFLRDSGHDVVRLREVMVNNSPDPVVATACRDQGRVLVTHNVKDFKKVAREFAVTNKQVDSLCRIELGCKQIVACDRIKEMLSIIEFEWFRLGSDKKGMRITVRNDNIILHR